MAPTSAPSGQSASPAPTDAVEPAIGYLSLDESQAFVQTISAGVRSAAADAGIPLVECDAGWTRSGVQACASRLAQAGVRGVISFQPFDDLAEEVCATIGDRPTVGIVYDQGPCQVSRLEIDQAESGRLAGAALGELAKRRFDCRVKAYLSLEAGPEDSIGGARMAGFREGYQEHCPLPRDTRRLSDAQHFITAQTQVGGVLRELKGKPIIVAGVSDDAVLGAMRAAQQRDRANHLWLAGQLAQADAREVIACDRHLVASVAQYPGRYGELVVPALLDAIAGRAVAPRLAAELELVTADNVRTLFPATPACDG